MGLFRRKKKEFVPDFSLSEYDNWLNYLANGGSSQDWERMKNANEWRFKESEEEKFSRYQKEVNTISRKYYSQLNKIQNDWSVLYNLGNYTGSLAVKFEKDCLANIADYEKMRAIDAKFNQKTATNIPALKRLAMLYEKQSRFEEAVAICKKACALEMDERSRMLRMIKKAGRTPTEEEKIILQLR